MIGTWKQFLLEKADEWSLPASGNWRFMVYNNYHPHMTTINLLWFLGGEMSPRIVTKLFREPELPAQEFANLRQIYGAAPDLTPKPLHLGPAGAFWALWMAGLPGERFRTGRDYSPDALRSIGNMLSRLHAALRQAPASDADRHSRMVEAPLKALEQFGTAAAVSEGCRRLISKATPEWLGAIPVIPQHGDLYSGNLLSDRGAWHIVDWESFGAVDLPLHDFFTLLLSMLLDGGKTLLEWDGALASCVGGVIRSHMRELALPEKEASVLLPLSLANWFHLQWRAGRQEFCDRMYRTITHYFEHEEVWNRVFCGS